MFSEVVSLILTLHGLSFILTGLLFYARRIGRINIFHSLILILVIRKTLDFGKRFLYFSFNSFYRFLAYIGS